VNPSQIVRFWRGRGTGSLAVVGLALAIPAAPVGTRDGRPITGGTGWLRPDSKARAMNYPPG
jgi:hypothetical protein